MKNCHPVEEVLGINQSNLIIIVSEQYHWNSPQRLLPHENDAKIVLLVKHRGKVMGMIRRMVIRSEMIEKSVVLLGCS